MSDIETFIKSIPEFKESRLASLYSNFEKNKILNPEGYEANIYAWQTLLLKLITSSKFPDSDISFVTNTANRTLGGSSSSGGGGGGDEFNLSSFLSISKYGLPQNLGPIINELVVHRKVFIPYSLFINGENDSEWVNKGTLIIDYISPKSWIKWGINSIFSKQYSVIDPKTGNLKHDRFIAWEQLTKLSNQYLEIIRKEISKQGTYSSKLFNNHTLYQFLKTKSINNNNNNNNSGHELKKIDFEILLKYWSIYKSVCTIRQPTTISGNDDTIYIKFDNNLEITDDDIGIINIQQNLINLQNRNDYLQMKLNEIDYKSTLLTLPKSEWKFRLKKLMNRKMVLTKSLMNSLNLYDELNNILVKINDSDLNYQMYHQLLISSKILQNMNNKVNLNDIDDLKIDIDEQIAKENEINHALTNDYKQNDEQEEVEDEELEKELNDLYKEINGETSNDETEYQQLENATKGEENVDNVDDKLLDKLTQLKVSESTIREPTKEKQTEPLAN